MNVSFFVYGHSLSIWRIGGRAHGNVSENNNALVDRAPFIESVGILSADLNDKALQSSVIAWCKRDCMFERRKVEIARRRF